MARIEGRPSISATIVISLNEIEAGALDALAGYGTDAFLRVFYEKLGKAYLQPYEEGLRSLFDSILNGPCSVKNVLDRSTAAKRVFSGECIAKPRENN